MARVLIIACLFFLAGCQCSDEFEHLTLGISTTPDETRVGGITTPRWGGTWEHPAGQYLVATATVGVADPLPPDDAFELYEVVGDELQQLAYVPRTCTDPADEPVGSCELTAGDGCESQGLDWLHGEPLAAGRNYVLVHRLANGTGKPLNFEGEGAEEFDGDPALVMQVKVVGD